MKPWKKFSPKPAVLPQQGKNTLKKVSFLLLRFLCLSKENEDTPKRSFVPKLARQILALIILKPIRNFHTFLV
ncbi:MAG: hypothetical protein H6554_01150 [Chitinophagales bacterium]|nr:hypothetical protein [Chitinophagales bacterium]